MRHAADNASGVTGEVYRTEVVLDTNGLGDDLGVEQVIFRTEDGKEKFVGTRDFKIVKTEGNIVTYELQAKIKDAGVFRYGYRIYPKNPALPHRQDFAFLRWI